MNQKIRKVFTSWRVILLLAALLFAVIAINPSLAEGVAIRGVVRNSSAADAGILSPKPTAPPMSRERIIAVDSIPIKDVKGYHDYVSKLEPGQPVVVYTSKSTYRLVTKPLTRLVVYNETVNATVEEVVAFNESVNNTVVEQNRTVNRTIEVPRTETVTIGTEDIGLKVYEAPSNNIRKGLDLQGGTRVLLKPASALSRDEMGMVIEGLKQRLNVYGVSDVIVRSAGDLSGNQFAVVEIAGANEDDVKELLAKQGKFEAKIGNNTVFHGGKDITYVCRSADCSGIDPAAGCSQLQSGVGCRFRFSIALSPAAAKRQADLTSRLSVLTVGKEGSELPKDDWYLNETLDLFLDDQHVDTLNIGSDLRGRDVSDIAISGWGSGTVQQDALFNALENMKRLQTILITGSLPVKLEMVKVDTISPFLGEEFLTNSVLVGILALAAVSFIVLARYRKIVISIPIIFMSVSEVVLLLGLAALIGWNIDVAAIAGIIIAVGTGVNDQIVITDETLRRESQAYLNLRQKIKNAFFIVVSAYATIMVAMLPLLFAGAGLLKGFAITTMIGLSFGVLITRPAYAAIAEILLQE